ncbi:MAG: DUF2804 domain-containing protein [Solirubrobacterales bacterium]
MRKRWRYVGVYCDELMLCAARVTVGPFGQTFWAVLDRSSGELIERTRTLLPASRGEVWSETTAGEPWRIGSRREGVVTRVEAEGVRARIEFGAGAWGEAVCPAAGAYVWTRKRVAPVRIELRLADGRSWERDAYAIEDESAGYHPRRTHWRWSAGVGTSADGEAIGWNLVEGVNDPPRGSERSLWIAGEVSEPAPVHFDGLDAVAFTGGEQLRFDAEAERRADENKLLIRSSYRQPFGTFTGELPGGVEIAEAYGVMEEHEALW